MLFHAGRYLAATPLHAGTALLDVGSAGFGEGRFEQQSLAGFGKVRKMLLYAGLDTTLAGLHPCALRLDISSAGLHGGPLLGHRAGGGEKESRSNRQRILASLFS